MPNKNADIIRLQHIRDACREVADFICKKNFNDLKEDRMLALSLIKEIEMIGEAAGKISDPFRKKFPHIPWDIMVAARHRLVHGYFDIDLEIIWKTVTQDLPPLLIWMDEVLVNEEKGVKAKKK